MLIFKTVIQIRSHGIFSKIVFLHIYIACLLAKIVVHCSLEQMIGAWTQMKTKISNANYQCLQVIVIWKICATQYSFVYFTPIWLVTSKDKLNQTYFSKIWILEYINAKFQFCFSMILFKLFTWKEKKCNC